MRASNYSQLPLVIETSPSSSSLLQNGSAKHHHGAGSSSSSSSSRSSSPTMPGSPGGRPASLQRLSSVVRSAIPQLLFLCVYGMNGRLHIQPRFDDLGRVRLYNISAIEAALYGTPLHLRVSAARLPLLDLLSGLPYLFHYFIPVVYPLYLWARGQPDDAARFYWLLGWSSWALYIVWFLFPTAPPWLADATPPGDQRANHTLLTAAAAAAAAHAQLHKEGCAFQRVDAMLGVPLFHSLFRNNPMPFASFPSGHVMWSMCIYVTSPPGGRWFALYVLWMSWATLYSCHHYLADVLAAIAATHLVRRLLAYAAERRPWTSSCPPAFPIRAVACPMVV